MRERLLVVKDVGDDRIGAIWVPERSRRAQTIGTVIAVGPGYYQGLGPEGDPIFQPSEYREGDRVVFGEYSGVEVHVDGSPVWVLTPDEIHARLERRHG